jgi:glyoxylase-like metal-dependent hydrolase (beta-lactamase superfamily II)
VRRRSSPPSYSSAAIVETGPATCLDSLGDGLGEHGVSPEAVHQVFLTHIHLDHAGASGHLAEMLAEGATPEESGRYDLAGDYPTLVDGLMRYVSRQRERVSE